VRADGLPRLLIGALVLVAGIAAPVLPPLVALGWWAHRRLGCRREAHARVGAVRRALPDAVDLLTLAGTAGLSLALAHRLVAEHVPAPLGPALVAADEAARAGRPRADALRDHLAPLGDRARALAQVLGDHLRYGVPLLPALERTSLELRLDRRRAAEVEARRVPVRLLGPLVACVLPAFALLTVVPLLAASLDALPT
jgi:tight adherence protein C